MKFDTPAERAAAEGEPTAPIGKKLTRAEGEVPADKKRSKRKNRGK